jgi:hypothetical protein
VDDREEHETLVRICPLLRHLDGCDVVYLVVNYCKLSLYLAYLERRGVVVVWDDVDEV